MEADYEFKKRIERFTTGVLIGGKGSSDLEEHREGFKDDAGLNSISTGPTSLYVNTLEP